jgi:transcription elongation factor Elf1
MTKTFQCPRCNGERIIDNGDTIDCVDCKLEFEKEDLEKIKDKSSILSLKEKSSVFEALKE